MGLEEPFSSKSFGRTFSSYLCSCISEASDKLSRDHKIALTQFFPQKAPFWSKYKIFLLEQIDVV
jgi:hypothetical protein